MKYLLFFSLILSLSCSKQKSMEQRPLKAVPTATVNGKVITLHADESTGNICAFGWQMSEGSPIDASVVFSPASFRQGEKNPNRNQPGEPYYISGTLEIKSITATVSKMGNYIFSLQVLDANRNESWADVNVEVK